MRLPQLCVLGAVVWTTAAPVSAADSFAAGVLACAAQTNRDQRLDCYDRAVAGYTAGLSNSKRNSTPGAAPAAPATSEPSAAAPPSTAFPAPAAASGPAASAASVAASAPAASATAPSSPARHFSGRIVSVEHFPDFVILHLDNEQAWKQVSDSPAALALRTGDPVTIDKQFGSFWLAGPKGEAVQVKLEPAGP